MPLCTRCKDIGVIETGNNDIPCDCPAGDTAVFNVGRKDQVTGAEIKRRNTMPQPPTKEGDRVEFGHLFKWNPEYGWWQSTSGQRVYVVPPDTPLPLNGSSSSWFLILPEQQAEELEFSGHEAERRAFVVAEGYTRQKIASQSTSDL